MGRNVDNLGFSLPLLPGAPLLLVVSKSKATTRRHSHYVEPVNLKSSPRYACFFHTLYTHTAIEKQPNMRSLYHLLCSSVLASASMGDSACLRQKARTTHISTGPTTITIDILYHDERNSVWRVTKPKIMASIEHGTR
jgi:hypothetical protein